MFRRLRERIAEEATKFPVGQDLITLSDSSAVIEPFASSPQFSIAGDEDASFSDPNSPQKKVANSSAGSELYATPNNKGMFEANSVQSPKAAVPAYIPQTDIESEVEESPTLNLDGISKEQLLSTIEILKARLCKYKNKYGEVVKAYKNMNEEKKKLEHALTENQDKSLRRIGELREQCQLEQKAKAHLEENLRLILEEKDSRISVLETQINLLKESQSSNVPVEIEQVEQNSVPSTPENVALQEKIQKLQALLKECKTTIMSKTEQIAELSKEKEALCQKVVTQSKASEEFEEKEANIRMEYDQIIEGLKNRLAELERQQEDSVMSMAETKKNMHEELELKERQLVKTKEEARQLQLTVDHEKSVNLELRKQLEEKLRELQTRLETTEQIMEEGKQNLVKELSRGKAEAVALIQQESAKRIASIEQECSEKLKELEFTLSEKLKKKEEELMSATSKEEELNAVKNDVEALKSQLEAVEKEKASLETRVRELESQADQAKIDLEKDAQGKENLLEKLNDEKKLSAMHKKELCALKAMVSDLEMNIVLLKGDLRESGSQNSMLSDKRKLNMYKERWELLMSEKELINTNLKKALKDRQSYKMYCCENGDILQMCFRENVNLNSDNDYLKGRVNSLETELVKVSEEFGFLSHDIETLLVHNTEQNELIKTLVQHIDSLENRNSDLKSSLVSIEKSCSAKIKQICSLEKELKNIFNKKSFTDFSVQTSVKFRNEMNNVLEMENMNLKKKVCNLENELAKANNEFKFLLVDIDNLIKDQSHWKSFVETIMSRICYIEGRNSHLSSSLKSIQELCSSHFKHACSLEEKITKLFGETSSSTISDQVDKIEVSNQKGPIENANLSDKSLSTDTSTPKGAVDKEDGEGNDNSARFATIHEMREIFQRLNDKLKHTLDKNQWLEYECKNLKQSCQHPVDSGTSDKNIHQYKSKKHKRNKKTNLASIREIDDGDAANPVSGAISDKVQSDHDDVVTLSQEAKTFDNLLRQVERENSLMQEEMAMLKQWAENCEIKYVSEIASLHKYLNDAREECSNLGLVLQSLESEIEARNSSIDVLSDDTGSRLQVSYLKSLIHDMQRREVGLSNLLQKTKSRYENEIAKMNSELVVQMETINSHTDYLDGELQSLKDHLKESHKKYAVEREHLLQQISCRNLVLGQLRNILLNVTEMFNSKASEFQDKILLICETYNQRIAAINQTVCKNMKLLLQQCKLFHELQKTDETFGKSCDSAQKFNRVLSDLDSRLKNSLLSSVQSKLPHDDVVASLIIDAFQEHSLVGIYTSGSTEMCCDIASMELELCKLREKLKDYDKICEKNGISLGNTVLLDDFIEGLKSQSTNILKENHNLKEKLTNMSKSLKLHVSKVRNLKTDIANVREAYSQETNNFYEKFANLSDLWMSTFSLGNELSANGKSLEKQWKAAESKIQEQQAALHEKIAELNNLKREHKGVQDLAASYASQLDAIKDQMQSESASSFEKIQKYEAEISELKRELSQLEEVKNRLVSDYDSKVSSMEEELKIKLDEQSTEFLSKLDSKEVELRQLVSSAETREKELKESANKLQAELALKQSALERVEKELSSLKSSDCEKMEEFLRKIKQLEQEREQLMLQAQERVAATELKFREDIAQLQGKVNDLQEQNKEIAKLKSENSKLSYQLDESLLVAAGNQSAVEKELSRLREHIQHLNEKLSEKDKEVNNKDQELSQTLSDLGEKDALVDNLKQEKDSLNEKLQSLEMQLNHSKELEQKVMSLKDENSNLRSELDSLATVKQEKDELNSKISSLERLKRDLDESVMLLKTENDVLKASEVSLKEELNSLVSEKDTLADQLRQLEKSDSKCPDCAALECNLKDICDEYEEKLRVKDAEVEEKLKLVIKGFYSQLNMKDYDCDLTVSELLEQSKSIEEKLEKEHKLEVAALQQDIFEKDFALEEMHEHYETIIKEKDATIRDYEKKLKYHPGGAANAELQATEPSDWDDTWVVPEESCEAVSPSPTNKADCDKHKKEIETLQEELEKCNTELKDLRILLRLTPPQSLHSNNNYSSMIPISEPTEFEYLKNILFEYMMGKETVTLVKVIAAVLKFSDEQTRLIIEREKSKHQAK